MNIYISEELSYMSKPLKKRGYNIVKSKFDHFDVFICNLKESDISSVINERSNLHEVLVIDGRSKSINDIDNILNNRHFTSLY